MSLPRCAMGSVMGSLVVLSLVTAVPAAAAPDCDGGSIAKLRLASGRMRLEASITRRGVTHSSLVAAADGTVLYAADIPSESFARRRRTTKYDGTGTFRGTIVLKNSGVQADTVRIALHAAKASL